MDHQAFAQMLGSYGEFVGAIAVVITLGYLAVQIRQNTAALRSSTWQAIQNAEHLFDQSLVGSKDAAEIWVRASQHGLDGFDDPVERFRCLLIGKQLVDQFQTHHYQREQGLIDPDLWKTWVSQFDEEVENSPGFVDVLRERYPHLRPSFRRFVDDHGFAGGDVH